MRSGVPPLADYGLSEVPGHAAHGLDEPEAKVVRTEGRPYDGTEVRILGADRAPLPAGEVGNVVVNGPSRFLGFLHNDELTRESLTDWGGYSTGDLGYLDEDGHLGLRRAQQGHHPPRRRHDRAGRARARAPAPPRDPRGRGGAAARRAARRARLRGADPPARRAGPDARATSRSSSRAEGVAKYTWPESVEVFDEFPRTPSLKVVKRDVVRDILDAHRRGGLTPFLT